MSGGYGTDALEVTVVATTGTPSPSSPVNLCNSALVLLGQTPIVSLDDDTDAARICRIKWPEVRDAVLRQHRWRCLTRRVQLARRPEPPAWGYLYAFDLPPDCFRVLEFHSPVQTAAIPAWTIGEHALLTDEPQAFIAYIGYDVREDNISLFDSTLYAALVARLAAEMCPPLKSADRFASLWAAYERKLDEAKAAGMLEASPVVHSCMTLLSVR